MQINQQIISGFIESGLNWLTEQVVGRIDTSLLKSNGQAVQTLNLVEAIKALPLEQKQEWNKYLDEMIAQNSRVIDLGNLPEDQNRELGRIIESYLSTESLHYQVESLVSNELEKRLGDSDLEDAINSHIGSYAWDSDSDWKSEVERIVSDQMEYNDYEDDIRKCLGNSSVLENVIRDNCSSIAEALDISYYIREALESPEGQAAIDEAVYNKLRSIFQTLAQSI